MLCSWAAVSHEQFLHMCGMVMLLVTTCALVKQSTCVVNEADCIPQVQQLFELIWVVL